MIHLLKLNNAIILHIKIPFSKVVVLRKGVGEARYKYLRYEVGWGKTFSFGGRDDLGEPIKCSEGFRVDHLFSIDLGINTWSVTTEEV